MTNLSTEVEIMVPVQMKYNQNSFRLSPSTHLMQMCTDERLGDPAPKVDPGAFSGQRQGWKTRRGRSGSALLLCV